MSYIESITQSGNTVTYCGPVAGGTELHVPGGIAVRLNPAAPIVLQFKNTSGSNESYEAYCSTFFGNGGQINQNLNAVALTATGGVWSNLDPDTMLVAGDDIQHAIICSSTPADMRVWNITAWRPTPTKAVIVARFDNTDTTVSGAVEDLLTEVHRITVNDAPAAYTTFNTRQYKVSDGWIPQIAGHFLAGSTYQGHGALFRINTNGLWELYADASGISVCTHTLDIVFKRYPASIIRRFGNFT
jgi:hypothetical protein